MSSGAPIEIREAQPRDYAAVGELTADVYVAGGHTGADSDYLAELRAAQQRATEAELLVAVRGEEVVGTVTFALPGSPWSELARTGEAEFRMLAVAEGARGNGLGAAMVRACIDRARDHGCSALVLSTSPGMDAAHRIYERLGFERTPERDWSPAPGIDLLAYRLGV